MTDKIPEISREEYLANRDIHKKPRRWWLMDHAEVKIVEGKPEFFKMRLLPMNLEQYDLAEAYWRNEFIRWRQACIDQGTIQPDMRLSFDPDNKPK